MKLEFFESDSGAEIGLIPETVEESSQLLRLSKNAKKEAAEIYFSFNVGQRASIWIKKTAKKCHINSIRSDKK